MNGTGLELVNTLGSSNKFWRIFVLKNTVITHYGRIGSNGSTTVKHFTDQYDASDFAYDKTEEKYRKGYRTSMASCAFPVNEALVQDASSSAGHTGFGGSNPEATWDVIAAWDVWRNYTVGMSIADIRALIADDQTPDAVRALAVYDDRMTMADLNTIAGRAQTPHTVRAEAFLRSIGI